MGGKGDSLQSPVPLVRRCYKAIKCSKEKDSANGRSSLPDVFFKKVFLKVFQYTQKISAQESLLNKVIGLQPAIL